MTTFRSLLKQIVEDNKEIKKRLSPVSAEKAQKYDELKRHLDNIELHVDSAKAIMGEDGYYEVVVKYTPIVKELKHSPKGIVGDDMFKSINALDLISYKDMEKIQLAIKSAEKLNEPIK